MNDKNHRTRAMFITLLSGMLMATCIACSKKDDPAVTNSGGAASAQRSVLTLKGAPR